MASRLKIHELAWTAYLLYWVGLMILVVGSYGRYWEVTTNIVGWSAAVAGYVIIGVVTAVASWFLGASFLGGTFVAGLT